MVIFSYGRIDKIASQIEFDLIFSQNRALVCVRDLRLSTYSQKKQLNRPETLTKKTTQIGTKAGNNKKNTYHIQTINFTINFFLQSEPYGWIFGVENMQDLICTFDFVLQIKSYRFLTSKIQPFSSLWRKNLMVKLIFWI